MRHPLNPKLLGLLGHPVSHSLSPEIFAFLSGELGIPVSYRALDIKATELDFFCKSMRKFELLEGWNVTLPHKESILKKIDVLSPEAKMTGAVNVVKVTQGRWIGHNTDLIGIRTTLQDHKIQVQKKRVAILGAGGAALAAANVIAQEGAAEICILNRNPRRAQRLIQRLHKQFQTVSYSKKISSHQYDLIVQATSVGMEGTAQSSLPILDKIPSHSKTWFFDLVYRPAITPFLREAMRRKCPWVGGLDMLVGQALGAWEIWIGPVSHPERVREKLKKHLQKYLRKNS